MKKCKNNACNDRIPDNRTYCSLKCRNIYVNLNLRDYTKISETAKFKRNIDVILYLQSPNKCLNCIESLPYDKRFGKFCNHSCSATYTNKIRTIKNRIFTEQGLQNIKENNQKLKETRRTKYLQNPNRCIICNSIIRYESRNNKTCSSECFSVHQSNQAFINPNCGGETNYRKSKYKNIWMDSSWEVKLASWMDDNDIEWIRDKTIWFKWTDIDGKERRYHPDFYLPKHNVYLDPKNEYLVEKDRFKIEQVKRLHKIDVIYGNLNLILEFLRSDRMNFE